MTVPVVWWNANPDPAIIARGYWDQGLLESLFAEGVWRVPGRFGIVHVHDAPRVVTAEAVRERWGGAIVVVPARHNVAYVDELVGWTGGLDWSLVILTGDEAGEFPVERMLYRHGRKLWIMTPQPQRAYDDAFEIGSGWPPGIRDVLADWTPGGFDELTWPWSFLGQVTHARREEAVSMLRERPSDHGLLVETEGFTQGWAQPDYWRALADSKVVVAPSGPCSPDSFRVYEALEAGAIPIADNLAPGDHESQNFWQRVFDDVPFPTVDSGWPAMGEVIDDLVAAWPASGNRVFSWWQRQKRSIAWRLADEVAELSGTGPVDSPARAITAVVVSSPTPWHPSIEHLEITITSIAEQLPGAEIILVFDGVRPELEHRRADYEEYVRRALWAANFRWTNVVPLVLDEHQHQANATKLALDQIKSRHLLFVEHDTPLVHETDWAGIVAALDGGEIDVVRLHHETDIGEHHRHMMIDREPRTDLGGDIPLVRTSQWSQRPHVAPVGWYRSLLRRHFGAESRTMIEDVMHGVCSVAWAEYGLAGWQRFRVALYAPGGNMQRSVHLDSRRKDGDEDPKFSMRFAYDGDQPEGAPQPGQSVV